MDFHPNYPCQITINLLVLILIYFFISYIYNNGFVLELILEQVEEVEKEVESLFEPVIGQPKKVNQEAGDGSIPVDKLGEDPN